MSTKILDGLVVLTLVILFVIGISGRIKAEETAPPPNQPKIFELPNNMVCGPTRDFIQVITDGKYMQVGQSEEPEWYNMMFYSPSKDFVIAKIYKVLPDITCIALNLDNVELKFNNMKPKTDATWKLQ